MALFDQLIPVPPTADEIKAEATASIKNEVLADAKALLDTLRYRHRMAFDRVWNHPVLSPSEAIAALGTDAVTIFTGSSLTEQFLAQQYGVAGEVYTIPPRPVGVVITPHADGTITLV